MDLAEITLHAGLWVLAICTTGTALILRHHLKAHDESAVPKRPDVV